MRVPSDVWGTIFLKQGLHGWNLGHIRFLVKKLIDYKLIVMDFCLLFGLLDSNLDVPLLRNAERVTDSVQVLLQNG